MTNYYKMKVMAFAEIDKMIKADASDDAIVLHIMGRYGLGKSNIKGYLALKRKHEEETTKV